MMNTEVQTREKASPKLPLYKLIWIFLISSVIGVLVETLFCLVFKGHLECRQGVIYGPFNQIYGLGAVILSLVLLQVRQRGALAVFAISALVGGIFEVVCSLFQECIFGTVSWDYNWMMFSLLGGRTNLLYMLFFGCLGVAYIYICFPWLSKLSDRIYSGKGIALTWMLTGFMVFNLCLSGIVVSRWIERRDGRPSSNSIELFIDTNYPDEMLNVIFPTMTMVR